VWNSFKGFPIFQYLHHVHTLANVLRCQRCKREGSKSQANLIALRKHPEPDPDRPAAAKRRSARK
jgi:hypothetical protein